MDLVNKAHISYSNESMIANYIKEYDKSGRKERVLQIDVNCKNSSTGEIVYDLYNGLLKDGRAAAVCYGRGPLVEEPGIYKFGLDLETKFHAGLARITGYNGCFSYFSTKRLLKFIEEFKPDLIHIHELHAYFVNLRPVIEYIKKHRIALIWTFHCEYMYTGKCGHAYDCEKWKSECGHCPAVRDYPKSLFFDRTKEMFKAKKNLLSDLDFTIVTPSEWLAERVKKSFLVSKEVSVINNGVDTSIFHPTESNLREKLSIPKGNKVILALAPNLMSEAKGGMWVLRLAEMMENEKVTFIMLGNDIKYMQGYKNVIFEGGSKRHDVLAQYYSTADIFVIFSKRETYSLTCAESLCCGTPVVGFKCGAPETVFAEPEAKFFNYGDLEAVKGTIEEYLFGKTQRYDYKL